jgi:hypothetical protein
VPRFILELEIEPFLDQLYETYVKVFREQYGLESSAANQKLVKVYASYREYRTHESDTSGPPPRENPAFIVNGQELVSFYDDTDPGEFYASVFHEGAHQFMSAVLPGAKFPLWIDEAMATYFEGCTWSRATKKVTVAFLPPDRLEHAKELLKDATPPAHGSLAEALFASVPEAQFQAKHYALSWSFIYYMLNRDDGKYRKNFALFLKAMNGAGTRPVGEIFKRATGMELVEMERGWRDAVLSWKAPPAPVWVRSEVTTPDPAVHFDAGDHVWSIDGIEVFDADSAKKAWEGRAKDRPCALLVVRRTKVAGPEQYTSSYVTLEVAASSPLKLEWRADQLRDCGLRD